MKVPASGGHSPCFLTVKDLKRTTYGILSKMHDLERGRKAAKIYAKMCSNSPCLVICLSSLRQSLASGLPVKLGTRGHSEMMRYLDLHDKLIIRVGVGLATGKAIESGYVSNLLSAHTTLFRAIGNHKATVTLPSQVWSDAVLPAVAIWKNRV
jgi:hypothetical protein